MDRESQQKWNTPERWKRSEGQTIDGLYPLQRYLGGGASSAVFLTEFVEGEPRRAALKLVPAGGADAESRIASWETASRLSHPNLIQILAGGDCNLDECACVYVVMEYADQDLSQVLADRVLTTEEAREMLAPLVSSLAYLHGKGFLHGHVKPSNVMGVGDAVKLSIDTVQKGTSFAEDARAFGVLLHQALTGHPPDWKTANLPAPFEEIVRGCLDPDPRTRWSMADVSARLRGEVPRPAAPLARPAASADVVANEAEPKKPPRWPIAAGAAAVVILALGGWLMRAPRTESSAVTTPAAAPSAVVTPAAPAKSVEPVKPAPSGAGPADVLTRALPEIPAKARNTIRGKVNVNVKVSVDEAGNVRDAVLEPPRSSAYLSNLTRQAALQWKFQPAGAAQQWMLRFQLFRDETKVSASRVE